ncbi:methyltransferase domain-containing protein [Streptomyces sp. HNM0575]|uniref:class I SAM-dependent methyltransferase n=1 Tax=Streptomyces sp. HNM0575 TaxID=2716338 RepID=UPI00145F7C7C|nr:methyltransferase [Streptomyces sp. HNM0575]NLU72597.1 methyltransferase domain-containing protein [Streptomyces sp. HNM0575]
MDNRTNTAGRLPAQRPAAKQPARHPAGSWLFLREAARNMRTTGAVAPSGRALAGLLAAPLDDWAGRPLDVLEAGAGTGSVTRVLLGRLCPGSRLDLVEANPRFAARLRRFEGARVERADGEDGAEAAEVRVHEEFVERLETGRRYDVIVSGLPLTNFAPEQVESIMECYLALLRPGGVLTWFAYRGTGTARSLLSSRAESSRHRAVEETLARYRNRYETAARTAWSNLPPATVWQLRLPSVQPAAAMSAATPMPAVAPQPPRRALR